MCRLPVGLSPVKIMFFICFTFIEIEISFNQISENIISKWQNFVKKEGHSNTKNFLKKEKFISILKKFTKKCEKTQKNIKKISKNANFRRKIKREKCLIKNF